VAGWQAQDERFGGPDQVGSAGDGVETSSETPLMWPSRCRSMITPQVG
jgi:hypothetical protein